MTKMTGISKKVVDKQLKSVRKVVEEAEKINYQFIGDKDEQKLQEFADAVTNAYAEALKAETDTVEAVEAVMMKYFEEVEVEEEIEISETVEEKGPVAEEIVAQETLFEEEPETKEVQEEIQDVAEVVETNKDVSLEITTVEKLVETLASKFTSNLKEEVEIDKEHENFVNFLTLMNEKGTFRKNKSEDDVLEVVNRAAGKKARDLEGKLALVVRQFGGLINLRKK